MDINKIKRWLPQEFLNRTTATEVMTHRMAIIASAMEGFNKIAKMPLIDVVRNAVVENQGNTYGYRLDKAVEVSKEFVNPERWKKQDKIE